MGLKKYRFDQEASKRYPNGALAVYSSWQFGPSLAGIKDCPIDCSNVSPRTVYIQGEADTYFSIPAVCQIRGCRVSGFVIQNHEGPIFVPNKF